MDLEEEEQSTQSDVVVEQVSSDQSTLDTSSQVDTTQQYEIVVEQTSQTTLHEVIAEQVSFNQTNLEASIHVDSMQRSITRMKMMFFVSIGLMLLMFLFMFYVIWSAFRFHSTQSAYHGWV